MRSGLLPSMMGVAHVAIQFPLYEALKGKLAERHHRDVNDLPAADLVRCRGAAAAAHGAGSLTGGWQVVASAISKMVASTATYPHEVVRAHMHVAGSGPFAGFASTCASVSPPLPAVLGLPVHAADLGPWPTLGPAPCQRARPSHPPARVPRRSMRRTGSVASTGGA